MSDEVMRCVTAFISIFGSPGLYSTRCAYRLSRDGLSWKEVEPRSLLHGIVVGERHFMRLLPPHAPPLPSPWGGMVVQPRQSRRTGRA